MPFFKLTEVELRDVAKRHIETLEFWLRRILDEKLTEAYGPKYWENEPPIVKRKVQEKVSARMAQSPIGRFSRWIDATLIEHQIDLLTNEELYREHFKAFFAQLFPANFASSREYLKFILEKSAVVRNALYHSNAISIRQAEQVVCYTNDIIDSIKAFYILKNLHNDFNAPSIISFSDSNGLKVHNQPSANNIGTNIELPNSYNLRSGDRIKFSIEVDASFGEDEYTIEWNWCSFALLGTGPEIVLELDDDKVGTTGHLEVKVKSNKSWHRHMLFDDRMTISFKVLPPL